MLVSFALAFLIAAAFGQRITVIGLALGSAVVLAAAASLSGLAAGLAALVGLQTGYLAGQAALFLHDGPLAAQRSRNQRR